MPRFRVALALPEIVGVGLDLEANRRGRDQMIIKPPRTAVIDRCLLGRERESHLGIGVAGAVPAGQGVRSKRLLSLELEDPFTGICLAGLGRLALLLGDAGDRHEAEVAKCVRQIKRAHSCSDRARCAIIPVLLDEKEGLMINLKMRSLLASGALAALGASAAAAAPSNAIANAETAAPSAIARHASVVTIDAKGKMTMLRKGSNGWTCMPDAPDTPGPDPMCFDASAGKWVDAWVHHKRPPSGTVGLMYMLRGGTDASNTDPYASKPTATNNWVKTGPHVMIVGSKEILEGHPASARPDTSTPYVMWGGTPYAHLMVPVAPH
jgi:hypothetical protein